MNQVYRETEIAITDRQTMRRRDFLRVIPALGVSSYLAWPDRLALQAAEMRRQGKACILLWMQGGPSQLETWDPKPGHSHGGETKAISTTIPGIEIADTLPQTSQVMRDVCVIRSMTAREGSHPRATYLLRTGYLPTASIKHPTLGAVAAQQLGQLDADLPSYVRIGRGPRQGAGAGFLGVAYDAFTLATAEKLPDNTSLTTDPARYQRRLGLLDSLQTAVARPSTDALVGEHQGLYKKAARLVLSPDMQTFDVQREPESMRKAYGDSEFGLACLLARRLVEAGVTFIEINLDGWDTHDDHFARTQRLCQQFDQPYAALLRDLRQRHLLDTTLVAWMGEFGRTPRINPRGGRDHYPRAFSVALAGAGVLGGQVIGQTSADGMEVANQPVTVPDLLRTICHTLGVDADRENNSPAGRPIKVVDGGRVVTQVLAGA